MSTATIEMPPAKPQPPQPMALASAVLQFAVASVAMMLGNKLAVDVLTLPSFVVLIQAVATLGLLFGFCRGNLQPFRAEIVNQWWPIAILFTLMIYTSMKSFVYVNVSTVLIFRNVGAILTTIVEYYVRGVTVNAPIVFSEILIVAGAVLYGHGSANFSWVGLFWILVNVCGQVAYGVLLKHQMDVHPHFKDMSKYTMSMYNNTLALPLLLIVMVVQGEHLQVIPFVERVDLWGWGVIGVTCFFGFLISTSGFGLAKLVSATTFLVVNNLTKFLNIGLGMMFLNDKLVGLVDASGCLVALLAGAWYSWESMKLSEQQRKAKIASESK